MIKKFWEHPEWMTCPSHRAIYRLGRVLVMAVFVMSLLIFLLYAISLDMGL
jgi:hypothetical protein